MDVLGLVVISVPNLWCINFIVGSHELKAQLNSVIIQLAVGPWRISAALCRLQVCKYFLEAIENNKYGWFWVCPAGGDTCMYRHALPPGFVLKKDKKKEEKEDEISLEELIENEVRVIPSKFGVFGSELEEALKGQYTRYAETYNYWKLQVLHFLQKSLNQMC